MPDSPPWITKTIDFVQLLTLFDQHNFGAQLFEPATVSVKVALQGVTASFTPTPVVKSTPTDQTA